MRRNKLRECRYKVGQEFDSRNPIYGKYVVTEVISSVNVNIMFFNTGTIVNTHGRCVTRGQVRDPYAPAVYGVGFMGVGKFLKTRDNPGIYNCWSNMLARCYWPKSVGYPSYGAKGCHVHEFWHNYQNFANWYVNNSRGLSGLEVDKDILIPGNKLYSPDNCKMVPKHINVLLLTNESFRTDMPIGVQASRTGVKYNATISNKYSTRSTKWIGSFNTPAEAHRAWQNAKIDILESAIARYANEASFDTEVAAALIGRVWSIRQASAEGKETIFI